MRKIFIHQPIFRICAPPVFGLLSYLLILLINNSVSGLAKLFSNQELYVCIALGYISSETLRLSIRIIERRGKDWTIQRRIMLQIIISLLAAIGMVALSISAYFNFAIGFSIGRHELNMFLVIFGSLGLLYNLLYFSHFYLQRENITQLDIERKLQEKVEADFISFKSEINPDLLYESLENLILTIHHNTDLAEEQIDYLAGIYRYSLVNRQKELISLEEELHVAEHLLQLLNFRHQGHLNLFSDIHNQSEIFLIPGSLMVSIDTIVRNTLISPKAPLVIRLYIEEEDDYLVLQHTLNEKLMLHHESLSAFARLQRSYSFFSDKPFVQVKAGRENFIKFPLIRVTNELATEEK
jgi:hypothetical protein